MQLDNLGKDKTFLFIWHIIKHTERLVKSN